MKKITSLPFTACSLLAFLWLCTGNASAQTCNINFSVGPDTLVNCNAPYTIIATAGMNNYTWNTGATASSIIANQPGTYWCIATDTLASVVTNGDFSQGQVGFTSDYVPGTGGSFGLLSLEGTYAVTPNSQWVHTNFANCFDHTVGTAAGSMLVVNGSSIPNQVVWGQNVTVQPNTNYIFSVWAMSVVNSNPGQLIFSVNGVQLGNVFTLPAATCNWQSFNITWNSGANTNASIAILNQNAAVSGNDFAIDDISFAPICIYSDTAIVSHPPIPVTTVSANDTICPGESAIISATSSIAGSTFLWNPGGLPGATLTVSPTITTLYTVNSISPQGCSAAPKQVTVWVAQQPQVSIAGTDSVCLGDAVTLTASSLSSGISYIWQPGNVSGAALTVTPPGTTIYSVTGTSPNGCASVPDSFTVTTKQIPQLTLAPSYSICEGDSVTITATADVPSATFLWQPTNETTASITVNPAASSTYSVTATAAGCTSGAFTTTVTVNEIPVVIPPDDQSVCPGQGIPVTVASSVNGASFVWQPGNLSGADQTLSPDSATYYVITATANGCVSEPDSFLVTISQDCNCDVFVPNVFTPNKDYVNDHFFSNASIGCNFKDFNFVVYNRWGNLVWTAADPSAQWDGTSNGSECTEGTYFWTMNYVHEGGGKQEQMSKTGTLTLFK